MILVTQVADDRWAVATASIQIGSGSTQRVGHRPLLVFQRIDEGVLGDAHDYYLPRKAVS
jgi:hypothetical protein